MEENVLVGAFVGNRKGVTAVLVGTAVGVRLGVSAFIAVGVYV